MAKKAGAYLVTFLRLILNSAREESSLQDLVDKKLLTEGEQEYFASLGGAAPHASVLLNILIQDAASNGLLGVNPECTQSNLICLQQDFQQLRGNALDALMYIDVQLPLPFVQMVCAVTYGLLVQLIYVCASFVSYGISTGLSSWMVTGYLTIVLYSFVMMGLLKLFVVVANPLGYDAADYPADTYVKLLEGSLAKIRMSSMAILESTISESSVSEILSSNGPLLRELKPGKDDSGEPCLSFVDLKSKGLEESKSADVVEL